MKGAQPISVASARRDGERERAWTTPLVPFLALVLPVAYVLLIGPIWLRPRLTDLGYGLAGTAVLWFCALGVMALVRLGQGRPLGSLGFRGITVGNASLAVGSGVVLSLLVPLLAQLAAVLLPAAGGGVVETAARYPAWFMLLNVVSVAFTEEVLFRAYPLELLQRPRRFPLAPALIGLLAFVLLHVTGWNPAHVVGVVLPLGVALTVLYLWKRNVWFVMIVHLLIDLPLVVMAQL